MKKQILNGVAIVAFFLGLLLVTLKAKIDTDREAKRLTPDTRSYIIEVTSKGNVPAQVKRKEPAPEPKYTTSECIEAINAGYIQIWEQEQTPKSAAPTRYPLTDEERAAIERMVASEGGYCEYEFQALVAECIFNDCEADGLRPLELFKRGDFWLTHDVEPTETTKQAVSDVFDTGIMPTAEKVRYYYNPNFCTSPAHESKVYVLTHTGCRFFKD